MGREYKAVTTSILDFILNNWAYLDIESIRPKNLDDVFYWCYENLEQGWYHHRAHHRMVYFENSDDKFLFELTWV